VGRWFKTTGAKIAKVALKVFSVIKGALSHVVKFIPGVGPALSKGLKLASKATSMASDAIKVRLSPKLEGHMKRMDIARDPIGTSPSLFIPTAFL